MIAIKENDYFLAAKALGSPLPTTLRRHVLPNIMAPLIIVFSINIGGVIFAEASLRIPLTSIIDSGPLRSLIPDHFDHPLGAKRRSL